MSSQHLSLFNVASYVAAGAPIATAIANAITEANGSPGAVVFIPASVGKGGSIRGLGPGTVVLDFRTGQTVYASRLVAAGAAGLMAALDRTGIAASVGATALLAAADQPGAGMWRAHVAVVLTTAGVTAGTITASVGSNNGVAGVTQTTATLSTTAALGTEVDATFAFYHAATADITWSTTLTGGTGTPAWAVRIRLESLG